MLKKLLNILPALVVIGGLALLLYPTVSNFLVEQNASRAVGSYDAAVASLTDDEYQSMLQAAHAFNERLASVDGTVAAEVDQLDDSLAESYNKLLNLNGDGMMGYLTIPRLDETLPLYHGTEEAVLQVGAGHIEGTSLPVGGASTHAALSGHRGLPSAKLFTDLDQMQAGDVFYIRVLRETFAYEVDQTQVVLPSEFEPLAIESGEDYVTLVTCTPYGINSHRLLVRGHRIDYTPEMEAQVGATGNPFNIPLPYACLLAALVLLLVIMVVFWARRRKRLMKGGQAHG